MTVRRAPGFRTGRRRWPWSSVAGMSRGAVATAILKAIMAGGEYPPAGVPDNPHNKRVWDSMKRDVDSLPPGETVDIPSDWADA